MPAQNKGFTLVELLVVISIIAILSVIGITVFSGVQKSARDAKRRGDIDAISKALEVHYGECTVGKYCNLQVNYFASGGVPIDQLEAKNSCGKHTDGTATTCQYCFLTDGDLDYKRGQNEAHNGCTRAPNGSGGSYGYNNAQVDSPGGGTNYVTSYILCANLETPTGAPTVNYPGGTMYYCKFSQQ